MRALFLNTVLKNKSVRLLVVSLPSLGNHERLLQMALVGQRNQEAQKMGVLGRVVLVKRCIN